MERRAGQNSQCRTAHLLASQIAGVFVIQAKPFRQCNHVFDSRLVQLHFFIAHTEDCH
jgi:hypothetical protein